MTITEKDGTHLNLIITGLIMSREVLGKIAPVWKKGLFNNPWADTVAKWCVDYYNLYKEAPKKTIRHLFHIWAEDGPDEDTEKSIREFLGYLSDNYDPDSFNPELIVDIAGVELNRVRLTEIKNRLEMCLAVGDIEKAESVVTSPKIEVGKGSVINIFDAPELVKQAVLSRTKVEPLIKFEGALGTFTETLFERDSFVAFEGPEKRGKSYWLQEMGWQAMLQGRKVAFFSCGDLSEMQMMRRLVVRGIGRPLKGNSQLNPVKFPTYIEKPVSSPMATVTYEDRIWNNDILWKDALQQYTRICKEQLGGDKERFKLSTHATMTLTVAGMTAIMDRWESQGWVPDIVIVDYADILAPPNGKMDSQQAINHNWGMLRSLSLSQHILILTATQTDADSYDVEIITKGNFSGSKTKNAHVTAMIALNQTPIEKDAGIYRLSLPAARETEFSDQTCVYTAGCLSVCQPLVLSTF